jgi:MFS family permease
VTAGGSRWSKLIRALKSRNYRLFFMGQGLSLVGTWMQRTALLWFIGTQFTDDRTAAFWLGVVGFSGQIPALVVTPLAGALADRWNRHRMVIGAQTLAMIQAFVLAGLTLSGALAVWHVIALSVWLGTVNAIDIPARQSFLIEMVDRPEDLSNAIALNSSIVNAGRLVGPALGGLLTAAFGVGICFLLNGLSYLTVIGALLAMRLKLRPEPPTKGHVLHNLADGFLYAFRSPPIRGVLVLMALVSLVGIPYASLLPVFAKYVLSSGPEGYGALVAAVGVGALLGAFYLASRSSVLGLDRLIAAAPLLFGAGLICFSFSRDFALSMALMPILGLGQMLLMAGSNTILQAIVEDDKRGRVMSFFSLSFMGMVPVGNLLAGIAARHIGPATTVAIGGGACIVGALYFSIRLPALRRLVHPIYISKGIIPEVATGLQAAAEQMSPTGGTPGGAATHSAAKDTSPVVPPAPGQPG